jgi:hypothetical protein
MHKRLLHGLRQLYFPHLAATLFEPSVLTVGIWPGLCASGQVSYLTVSSSGSPQEKNFVDTVLVHTLQNRRTVSISRLYHYLEQSLLEFLLLGGR